jgi:hypothetical protein
MASGIAPEFTSYARIPVLLLTDSSPSACLACHESLGCHDVDVFPVHPSFYVQVILQHDVATAVDF